MPTFQTTIDIAVPPSRVWDVMSDVKKWHEWTASITKVEILSEGPLDVGGRARVEQPKLSPAVWTITDWQPGRGFAWVSSGLGVRSLGGHWIEPMPGGSRVTLKLDFSGWLSFAVPWLGGKLIDDYMRLEAEGLKRRSEAA